MQGTFALKHSVETLARFSDLKVGIRELSFAFMQEPTEKQPLRAAGFSIVEATKSY